MSGKQTEPTAAQAARELTGALNTLSGRLESVRQDSEDRDEMLRDYGRRNRRLIIGTIASVVLDIVLTVSLALVAIAAHNASVAARKASASNLALCEAGNIARHQQIALWSFVLDLPKSSPQTAREQQNVAAFKAYLGKVYAPRNCAHLPAPR